MEYVLVGAICLVFGMLIGAALGNWTPTEPEEIKITGRVGCRKCSCIGDGLINRGVKYGFDVWVEELGKVEDMSRIKVLEVLGGDLDVEGHVRKSIGEYIKTNTVRWYDNDELRKDFEQRLGRRT